MYIIMFFFKYLNIYFEYVYFKKGLKFIISIIFTHLLEYKIKVFFITMTVDHYSFFLSNTVLLIFIQFIGIKLKI